MLSIRLANEADWAFWRTLDGHISKGLFLRKTGAGECYVAEADGVPAGLLRWNLFWDEIPFCTLLYIREDCRGKGYGSALMARWEADMAARGHGMVLTSTQADETAQLFYRKLGYGDCGGFAPHIPGYAQPTELILAKGLEAEA